MVYAQLRPQEYYPHGLGDDVDAVLAQVKMLAPEWEFEMEPRGKVAGMQCFCIRIQPHPELERPKRGRWMLRADYENRKVSPAFLEELRLYRYRKGVMQ